MIRVLKLQVARRSLAVGVRVLGAGGVERDALVFGGSQHSCPAPSPYLVQDNMLAKAEADMKFELTNAFESAQLTPDQMETIAQCVRGRPAAEAQQPGCLAAAWISEPHNPAAPTESS